MPRPLSQVTGIDVELGRAPVVVRLAGGVDEAEKLIQQRVTLHLSAGACIARSPSTCTATSI
jgi:hypothetical protein